MKLLSIELSLLLLVSVVAFAGFISFQSSDAEALTGYALFGSSKSSSAPKGYSCGQYGGVCAQSSSSWSWSPYKKPATCPAGYYNFGSTYDCNVCCKKQDNNVVLLIDISGSTQDSGLSYIKSVANKIIDQLTPDTNLGVVAFNTQAFIIQSMSKLNAPLPPNVSPISPLVSVSGQKENVKDKISRLYYFGGTLISKGLVKATSLLSPLQGSRTIILISDGRTLDEAETIQAAKLAVDRGIKIDTRGVGPKTKEQFMIQIAQAGKGSFKNVASGTEPAIYPTLAPAPQPVYLPPSAKPTPTVAPQPLAPLQTPTPTNTPLQSPPLTPQEIKVYNSDYINYLSCTVNLPNATYYANEYKKSLDECKSGKTLHTILPFKPVPQEVLISKSNPTISDQLQLFNLLIICSKQLKETSWYIEQYKYSLSECLKNR